jgi:hypothetical protein
MSDLSIRRDLSGSTFGAWTVLCFADVRRRFPRGWMYFWLCRCKCGTKSYVQDRQLLRGKSTQCRACANRSRSAIGGLAAAAAGLSNPPDCTAHGHSVGGRMSTTYQSWMCMKQRCLNPKNTAFDRYGGRGITVCDRWRDSFENFLADMGERPEGMTLDRINPDGNYEPLNCRWADATTQARNKSKTLTR